MQNVETILFRLTAAWTVIGLASGLAYRELTKAQDFTGYTQLAVVHTHALTLGTLVGLVLLALQRLYALGRDGRFRWVVWTWTVGLALTAAGLVVKGSLQVLGSATADSPALAGMSGTGHIVLTVAFALLLLVLGRRIRDDRTAGATQTRQATQAMQGTAGTNA